MHAPLFSTITLIAELIVSAIVYYAFYQGYKHDKFPEKLAIGAIVYEALFDIGYMVHRVPAQENHLNQPLLIVLGATHGILSLLMFLGLILFFAFAILGYRKKINYFKVHKKLTFVFLFFWTLSIISGIALYFVAYR